MADYDYIVIGAGHNGLVCAGYLAKAGQHVAVLEKYSIPGGFITTEEIPGAPGFKLNIGAIEHMSFYDTPIMKDLELEKYGLHYLFRDNVYLFPYLDGTDIPFYTSLDRTKEAIAKISKHDAEAYGSFVEFASAFLGILDTVSNTAPPTFGELAGLLDAQVGLDIDQLLWVLLTNPRAVLDSWFESPKVKAALGYYASHIQVPPSRMAAGYAPFIIIGAHGEHVGRPEGGSGKLIDALIGAIEAYSGTVQTNAQVSRILVENGRATGVELANGDRISASKGVVSSIDARRVFLDLMDESYTPAALRRRLELAHTSGTNIGEFKLDCALSEPLDWSRFPHGNDFRVGMHLVCPSLEYLDYVFADVARGVDPAEPAMLVCSAGSLDQTLVPKPGQDTLWVSAIAPYKRRDGRSWDDAKQAYADVLLDTLAKYAPNVRDAIIATELTSPLDWHKRAGSVCGNPNHMDMTLDQFFGYRPAPQISNYRTHIGGLYLSGSGVHPGGGLSGNPGYNTAQAVMQDLGLVKPPDKRGLIDRVKKLASLLPIYMKLRKYL
ncbi:MAG: NAD(P)/FAD-dependent oxidoreductase [Anaerolineales bacterium]|nr:NAD(P)/FAD-dependent oxidoreductase [Anaerolineales bacterium]